MPSHPSSTSSGERIKALIRPPSDVMKRRKAEVSASHYGPAGEKTLIFPGDLSAHFMALIFHRFHYDTESNAKTDSHNKTILLPVPLNLQEQVQTQYNDSELGAVGGEISDMIARGNASEMTAKMNAFATGAGELMSGVLENGVTQTVSEALTGNLRGNAVAQAATLGLREGNGWLAAGINRYFGSAPNPHITAIFRGVGLRTHNFSWKLSPASDKESIMLNNIINHIRAAMLPQRGIGNLTLKFPDEVDIYIGGSSDEYLYHFKRAVIRNMTTNFAPDGITSFFAGTGAPTAVNLTLDLLETSIHTRGDYEEVVQEQHVPGLLDSAINIKGNDTNVGTPKQSHVGMGGISPHDARNS